MSTAKLRYCLFFAVFFVFSLSTAQNGYKTYFWQDVFTVPPGVTIVTVEVQGRGGQGGYSGGGGGGGGGYAKGVYSVVPGATMTVRFGDTTSFHNLLYATSGGNGVSGFSVQSNYGGSGGKGVGGNIVNSFGGSGGNGIPGKYGGGGGGAGGPEGNGFNGANAFDLSTPSYSGAPGGAGGGGVSGQGGRGGALEGFYASYWMQGLRYGGGGGGGLKSGGGGSGANGFCHITWGSCGIPMHPGIANPYGYITACKGTAVTLAAYGNDTLEWFTDLSSTQPFARGKTATVVAGLSTDTFYVRSSACGGGPFSLLPLRVPGSPTVLASAVPSVLCYGESSSLTASGAFHYDWSHGKNYANPTYKHNFSHTADTTVFLSVAGRYYDYSECADTAKVPLLLKAHQKLNCITSATNFCLGDTLWLDVSTPGFSNYLWSNGAVSPFTTISPDSDTTIFAEALAPNGCTSRHSVDLNDQTPDINIYSGLQLLCKGESTELVALGAATYTWNTGQSGNLITVFPEQTTSYTVSGKMNGCVASASLVLNVDDCTATKENVLKNSVTVFPNPTSGRVTISGAAFTSAMLYNSNGQLIKEIKIDSASEKIELGLPEGLYDLFVEGRGSQRIIIQK